VGKGTITQAMVVRGSLALVAIAIYTSVVACTDSDTVDVSRTPPAATTLPVNIESLREPPIPEAVSDTTRAILRNVRYRLDDSLALNVRTLSGRMIPHAGSQVVNLNDIHSFVLHIDEAEVGLRTSDLSRLMNNYVLNYSGAPLRDLQLGTRDTLLWQSGIMHKVIDMPFEMTASVSVTPTGLIRIHPEEMTVGALSGLGLMRAVGVELADLLDLSGASGFFVEGDDLLLNPEQILPPPAIKGRVVDVRVEGDELILVFESRNPTLMAEMLPPEGIRNYMHYVGGVLRFGRMYMVDADLLLIDADQRDEFDFYLAKYELQLTSGFSRNTRNGGLQTYFRDFNKVQPGDLLNTNEVQLTE
jgi:hypothetical protein